MDPGLLFGHPFLCYKPEMYTKQLTGEPPDLPQGQGPNGLITDTDVNPRRYITVLATESILTTHRYSAAEVEFPVATIVTI